MTDSITLQKIAAFQADLKARGETLSDFCRKHGLDLDAAYMVTKGRTKGRFGKAHQVYVALGLKPGAPQQARA